MRQHRLLAGVLSLAGLFGVSGLRAEPPARLAPASERFSAERDASPSFQRHVLPLMSRAGCSGRACHGSFKGKGGFQLSLFGYDFAKDHAALTAGDDPRVDTADPDESLILLKPTLQEKHEGGNRVEEGSWQYHLLRRWIAAGAKNDSGEVGILTGLEVVPGEIVFGKQGDTTALKVIAHWSDGTSEDVTELSRFRTNDEGVAEISEEGVVESVERGDTHVVAFYDNGVAPVPVMLPVSDRIGERYPDVDTPTKIDELIVAKLSKLGVVPAKLCSDEEFLRRVSIDLTGTLPSPAEIESFLRDRSKDKRRKKIDELIESPAYAAWWTTKFCDVTGNNARQMGENLFRDEQSRQWYDWIYARVAKNTPYDEIVEGIVLATSRRDGEAYEDFAKSMSSHLREDDPVPFAERETMPHYWARRNMRKPEEKALSFSYAFLGVRLQCAQCHKHPFDQWSQDDFEHFQAFFEPLRFGQTPGKVGGYREMLASIEKEVGYDRKAKDARKKKKEFDAEIKRRVKEGEAVPWRELFFDGRKFARPSGKDKNRKKKSKRYSGRVVTPKLLGGDEVLVTANVDFREPLMDWLRDGENPYFAQAFVNRVWESHFGRGIVDPADDMNLANPPSNRALLDWLAMGFVESDYDMRWLHRTILQSDAYQRSWKTNATNELDETNFSRRVLRRLPAEVTVDAITQATASSERLTSFSTAIEKRSIGPDSGAYRNRNARYALDIFGKPARMTTCDCERSSTPTLLQTIYTRNDQELWQKIEAKDGWIASLRKAEGVAAKDVGSPPRRDRSKRDRDRKARRDDREKEPKKEKRRRGREFRASEIDDLIREVFLRTVSRRPTSSELERARRDVASAKSVSDGIGDLLWVMLNTKEFIVNH